MSNYEHEADSYLTCSVVVPCRNEVENVEAVVARMPQMGRHLELIFVDDGSSDGTGKRVEQLIEANPTRDIKLVRRIGPGCKAAAVFEGFDSASGDVLIILDADMTVPPEELPRFLEPFTRGRPILVTGTRFRYRMERGAMPLANKIGNRMYSLIVSWLVGARVTDTLCGTKALRRSDWSQVAQARTMFGGHDRWGDFDLLLGAASCGLEIIEVPVRYRRRVAGESKMQPLKHGRALLKTCFQAAPVLRSRRVSRAEGAQRRAG